jgi:hypothetical protein
MARIDKCPEGHMKNSLPYEKRKHSPYNQPNSQRCNNETIVYRMQCPNQQPHLFGRNNNKKTNSLG